MIDAAVVEAFHMMWGSFPAPVRLIHKNRKVLAVNEMAKSLGMDVGVPCTAVGNPQSHKYCDATKALATDTAQRMAAPGNRIKFWCPVRNCPDVFIHFTVVVDPQELLE